jgi:hypothetical protein
MVLKYLQERQEGAAKQIFMEAKMQHIKPQFNHASGNQCAPMTNLLMLQINQSIHKNSSYTIMNPAYMPQIKLTQVNI